MSMRLLGILMAAGFCGGSVFAQTPVVPVVTPILAELSADLEARHLTPGVMLYAQVMSDWNGLGCVLKQGAVLEAQSD